MRNFRNLEIWKDGILLVTEIYKIAKMLPNDEKFGLKSQLTRAAVSIPANIAEGCSRTSETEYKRFLEIALGSAFELETHLLVIQNLEILSKESLNKVSTCLDKEEKQINRLISTLSASIKSQ